MANSKNFNSKNIARQIQSLVLAGKENLALEILKAEELKGLLPQVLQILKRQDEKKNEFNQTKIYSKTSLDKENLKKIEDLLRVDTKDAQIIIDKNMSAGVRIKSKDMLVDATLETMIQNSIEKLLAK